MSYKVAALNLSPLDTYKYPKEVEWELDQNNKKDYINLAKKINDDANIVGVILQHEYGIFGGMDGENVILFMENCKKPIITTLHTALPVPSPNMKKVTEKIIDFSENIIVLTNSSKKIIESVYPKSYGKVAIIPHGIHPVVFSDQAKFKTKLELSNHIILSTFGLLSRGKGIEYVINSLPEVIKKFPSLLYLVIGETHPVIRRNEGEKYRLELADLVTKLGLEDHVKFYDQYLSLPDLLEFLQATDVYISSSINPNQAVSGTLSYALGTGRAVISTEFAQAKEIITPEVGRLVPIEDSKAMAAAINDLLGDVKRLQAMNLAAYEKTREMLWSNVSEKYTKLLMRTIIPPINLSHLYEMTDDTGLFQFAEFTNPNKSFGYTLDDNIRALIVCSMLTGKIINTKIKHLMEIYMTFVEKCFDSDGSIINYISFPDKIATDQNKKEDLEDSKSRAMWGLAVVMNNKFLTDDLRLRARKIFLLTLENQFKFTHIRSKAFAIKSFVLAQNILTEDRDKLQEYIKEYADTLVSSSKENSIKSWFWFEKDLNYSNALLSESLIIAGDYLKNSFYLEKGLQSLNFLIEKTFSSDMYMPIGHSHWYTNNEERSRYDQQPEDPAAMILALSSAFKVTGDASYKNLANKCFSWFLGNNSLGQSLYDEETGGCFDGLHPDRVNLNEGAESLVSYLVSSLTITKINDD